LRKFGLYNRAQQNGLFNIKKINSKGCFTLLIREYKGYPMLSWLMTLHKQGKHILLESLYNTRHKRGWLIIENAFGISIKKPFVNYMGK
jgi:hypothetical protein